MLRPAPPRLKSAAQDGRATYVDYRGLPFGRKGPCLVGPGQALDFPASHRIPPHDAIDKKVDESTSLCEVGVFEDLADCARKCSTRMAKALQVVKSYGFSVKDLLVTLEFDAGFQAGRGAPGILRA
jgi:hypothetical protein